MRALKQKILALTILTISSSSLFAQRSPIRDPDLFIQKRVVSWKELKTQNVVMQKRDYSCGAAAVATVLRYYWGQDVTEADVLRVIELSLRPAALKDRSQNGLTMADLKVACDRMDYAAAVGKLDTFKELAESKVPVVVSAKLGGIDHFVVFRGTACGLVFLADPIRGNIRLTVSDFVKAWNENAIFVVALEGKTKSAVSRLGLRADEVQLGYLNNQVVRRQLSLGK